MNLLIMSQDAQLATVQLLRTLLATRTEAYATGAKVQTVYPSSAVQPDAPVVVVRHESSTIDKKIDESAGMRVLVYGETEHKSLALAKLCHGLLLAHQGNSAIRAFNTRTGPVPASDPESGQPFASFTVAARLRPSTL